MIKYFLFPIFVIITLSSSITCVDDADTSESSSSEVTTDSTQTESVVYVTPQLTSDSVHFYEHFDDVNHYQLRWKKSEVSKHDSSDMKYDGQWSLTETASHVKGDNCLIVESRAHHHAIGAKLDRTFKFDGHSLILQYEVQFRNGQECGGAYLKLLSSPSGPLSQLNDKSQYSIMFGPDKCGNDLKLHFIFQHRNPKNGTITEKHWKRANSVGKLEDVFKDKKWHQLRLTINSDNTYEVTLDTQSVGKGSLLEDFSPPVNPPKEIDDPNDSKPEDWDENEKIPDPEAVKPEDWDENTPRRIPDPNAVKPDNWDEEEPEMIPDPDAKMPSDWDTEMDGEWEAPLISNPKCAKLSGCGKWSPPLVDNPKYKGKWRAPMIENPGYKGKWSPRKIINPDFFEDVNPYKMLSIDAVAFELWTISDGIAFDNILITDDPEVANQLSLATYQIKKEISDNETDNFVVRMIKYANKNPWMWAVYLLIIALPVVLFIAYCCISPKKQKFDANDAQRKKTDEVIDDDAIEEENDENQKDEMANDENTEDEVQEEDAEKTEEEPEEEETVEVRSSPRLRKTRARKE